MQTRNGARARNLCGNTMSRQQRMQRPRLDRSVAAKKEETVDRVQGWCEDLKEGQKDTRGRSNGRSTEHEREMEHAHEMRAAAPRPADSECKSLCEASLGEEVERRSRDCFVRGIG